MKLAYLAQSTIPSTAANSVHVMKMCAAFASCGVEVELIVPAIRDLDFSMDEVYDYYGVERTFSLHRVPYVSPGGSRLKYLISSGKLWLDFRRRLNDFKPDLVYGRSVIGCHAGVSLGISTGLEVHQPVWGSLVEGKLLRSLVKKDDFRKLVTITDALGRLYDAEGALGSKGIAVAADAADALPLDEVVSSWPGRPDCLQAGYIGSLHEGRGVEVVLELARRIKDVDFHLVGGDENSLERIRAMEKTANVFLHGFVPPSETHKYRNSCDVLLAPYQESIEVHGGGGNTAKYCSPLKIFEYMSARKAIMISDLPVFHEVLNSGNAVMLPPDDVDAWESALHKFHDADLREAYAAVAYSDFTRHHTWKNRAENILSFLKGGIA